MRVLDGCSSYGVDGRVRISNFRFQVSNKFNYYPPISLAGDSYIAFLIDSSSLLGSSSGCGEIPDLRWAHESL